MSSLKQNVQFIFSQDCPVQKRSQIFGDGGTVVVWLVLFIMMAVIPGNSKKKDFKTVQIVLSSPEKKIEKKAESKAQEPSASPAVEEPAVVTEQVVPPPEPAPVVPAKIEEPKAVKKTESSKTQTNTKAAAKTPVKTESKPAKTEAQEPVKNSEPMEYAMDMSDGVNFNAPAKTVKQNVDWDAMFGDESSEETVSKTTQKVTSKNVMEGTAGTSVDSVKSKITSEASTSKTAVNNSASGAVKDTLGKIADTSANAKSNSTSGSNAASSASDFSRKINWSNGKSRNLIKPEHPEINISPENAVGIDADKTVDITFTVADGGNVIDIKFVQSALLTEGLKKEIKDQISTWQFEGADYQSEATFRLNIKVK